MGRPQAMGTGMGKLAVLLGALVVCVGAAFLYPGGGQAALGPDIDNLRSASTLLFGIFSGFFVAFLLNRFAAIRSLLTRESTMLMEIYKLAQAFGLDFARRTADKIDTYLIVRFDGENYFRFTTRGRDALFRIFEDLAAVDLGNTQNLTTMHRHFVATLREAISLRRETIVTGTITVSPLQWCPLILLAVILIVTLFYTKSGGTVSTLLTGMLAYSIFLVLYVIKDLSDLNLGGNFLKYETIERVFEYIGKPRYYPLSYFRSGLVDEGVSTIRLGIGPKGRSSDEIVELTVEEELRRTGDSRGFKAPG